MFHVAPLLPFDSAPNSQQIERKRFIGNDIVNIIFLDADAEPFKLETLKSHQTRT